MGIDADRRETGASRQLVEIKVETFADEWLCARDIGIEGHRIRTVWLALEVLLESVSFILDREQQFRRKPDEWSDSAVMG